MATGIASWSQTAATNSSADSAVNWSEGQLPSTVNDSGRGLMASGAKYRDDTAGSLTTGGTSTAYTLTTNQVFASLTALDGMELSVKFNATNGAAPTLAVDGLTAKAINVSHATAVGTGVILANSVWGLTYNNSNNCFLLRSVPAKIQDATVATASLADAAVTLAKMENRAANKLIGRYTASTGVPQEVTVSTGLALDTSTGNLTAAFPPPSAFKNLSIKVASTTTVTVAADFVTTTDGTLYQTTALSGTINLGGNGAVNALDTGTIAIDTWYFIWAIAKADGTTGGLASLSSTAPTMPTGYTFKARIGAVKTIHATATLYGTWQLGRRAQYVVGLAQTSTAVSIGTTSGTSYTALTVNGGNVQTSFVPSTASEIFVMLSNANSTSVCGVAPNSSYGIPTSTTNPPPIAAGRTSDGCLASGSIILEAATIQAIASAGTATVFCTGWTDNI
jgi:hypothetical protein